MVDRMNWAGNVRYGASRFEEPATLAEASRIVAGATQVRPLGTRHSFNDLPDGPGVLLNLGRLPANPVLDEDAMTVTVSAGTRFGIVADFLESNGYALHNMGSLPHISVAGAISTGTHGSGNGNQNLSAAVSGLQFITPDGDLLDVDRTHPQFGGMVVALGALGPITRVTLDIQNTYLMQQDAYADLPWEVAIDRLDQITAAGYSVSLLTRWGGPCIDRVWVKHRLDETHARPDLAELGATLVPVGRLGHGTNMTEFGSPGPWSRRLPHFLLGSTPSMGEEIQVEWMVPWTEIRTVLTRIRHFSTLIDPVLGATEIRTMAGDDQWLSPARGHDMVGLHFTFHRDAVAVTELLGILEPVLLDAGARPHWGKLFLATAADLAGRYPQLPQWRRLRDQMDPDSKFTNAFISRMVGS